MKLAPILIAALAATGSAAIVLPTTASACTLVPGSGYGDGLDCYTPTSQAARNSGAQRTDRRALNQGPESEKAVSAQSTSPNAGTAPQRNLTAGSPQTRPQRRLHATLGR